MDALVGYGMSDESGIDSEEEDVKPTPAELAAAVAEHAAKEAARIADIVDVGPVTIKQEPPSDYPEEHNMNVFASTSANLQWNDSPQLSSIVEKASNDIASMQSDKTEDSGEFKLLTEIKQEPESDDENAYGADTTCRDNDWMESPESPDPDTGDFSLLTHIKTEPESYYPEDDSQLAVPNHGGWHHVVDGPFSPEAQADNANFDLGLLDRNRSYPIRIMIPPLSDIDDEPPCKKQKVKKSASCPSLFALLPAPKNVASTSRIIVPQSVSGTKQPNPASPPPTLTDSECDSEEDDDPPSSFFFTPHDPLPPPVEDNITYQNIPSTSSEVANNEPCLDPASSHLPMGGPSAYPDADGNSTDSEDEDLPLDDEAMRKLCGTRERKLGAGQLAIVNVRGSSLVGDNRASLAKDLTKEQPAHSFKRKSECSTLQRRKHQITYLAEQAKAQELELRNNWAQNRITRKQTQAKYGF